MLNHPLLAGLTARNFDTWDNNQRGNVISYAFRPLTANVLVVKGTLLASKNPDMAVFEAKVGAGRVPASQVDVFASLDDSSAITYLRNLLKYTVTTELRTDARELTTVATTSYEVAAEQIRFVSLERHANRSFTDDVDSDGLGGWFDQGVNDFRNMPVGEQTVAGVKFMIINPLANNDKSCLVATDTECPQFPLTFTGISVKAKFSRLFFLHTAAWCGDAAAGTYRVNYSDGKQENFVLSGNKNIADWWNPSPIPEAFPGIYRKNAAGQQIGTYVTAWVNPRPQVAIESIDFFSPLYNENNAIDWAPTKTAVTALIAVSGELVK